MDQRRAGGYAGLTVLAGIAVAALLAAVLVGFAVHSWLFPSPFERTFADGIEELEIRDGELKVRLAE